MWRKKTIVETIKDSIMPSKKDLDVITEDTIVDTSLIEDIDSLGDAQPEWTEDALEWVDIEACIPMIPTSLSTEDKARLEELNSYTYINSTDEDIISERDKLILLQKSIQIKKLIEDEYNYSKVNNLLKEVACLFYLESK